MSESLVKRLREKPSKYNRELLDEAADTIERLEKSQKTEANPIEKSNGMTEADIMKALECCGLRGRYVCEEDCPRMNNGINSMSVCERDLKLDALAILNRKNAEIERLEALSKHHQTLINMLNEGIAEAIKEVLEKVEALFPSDKKFTTISRFTLRQIAKEMGVEL